MDVLDPIQPIGPHMQPEWLKSHFGGRLCFHGGIDMQDLLPQRLARSRFAPKSAGIARALAGAEDTSWGRHIFSSPTFPPKTSWPCMRTYEPGAAEIAGGRKGTGPICRNGPEGASHKLDLFPFSHSNLQRFQGWPYNCHPNAFVSFIFAE